MTPDSAQLGLYLSIPFCRAKCSFCNFASGVFSADRLDGYTARLCHELAQAHGYAERLGTSVPAHADTVYFGGGTPSLLEPAHIHQIFTALRTHFTLAPDAEITVECAPGQFDAATLEAFEREGMNRVSLGVQSFNDRESAAVGRLHTAEECHAEVRRLKSSGIANVGLDLIVGLPHQTGVSWRDTVEQAIASGVEHVSIYMLEVDDGSRLGRESLAGGQRYGATDLPADDDVADWYTSACTWLADAGLPQYEISNFGRPSRHNQKYWTRAPYLGFGLDAHSMLPAMPADLRWANTAEMGEYAGLPGSGFQRTLDRVSLAEAFEESIFLGLRMVEGIDLTALRRSFGAVTDALTAPLAELGDAGLIERSGPRIRLTGHGRTISNEVFSRLLLEPANV